MNVPALLGLLKVARRPSLCLPHLQVPTFAELPNQLDGGLRIGSEKLASIRAVVLDKDNCFAVPNTDEVHPSCKVCQSCIASGLLHLSRG